VAADQRRTLGSFDWDVSAGGYPPTMRWALNGSFSSSGGADEDPSAGLVSGGTDGDSEEGASDVGEGASDVEDGQGHVPAARNLMRWRANQGRSDYGFGDSFSSVPLTLPPPAT